MIPITKSELDREFKVAVKNIRQANKGLPWPVKINKDFELFFRPEAACTISMRIKYLDGDCKEQTHNICL